MRLFFLSNVAKSCLFWMFLFSFVLFFCCFHMMFSCHCNLLCLLSCAIFGLFFFFQISLNLVFFGRFYSVLCYFLLFFDLFSKINQKTVKNNKNQNENLKKTHLATFEKKKTRQIQIQKSPQK